jgi:hypothetical protein
MTPPRGQQDKYDGPDRRHYDRYPVHATGYGNGNGNGHNPFAGLPLWARVVAMVGIPGTIAFFLVWTGANVVPKLQAEMQAMRLESERARLMYEERSARLDQTFRLLQRICSSVAKSEDERQRCFDR